MNIEKLKQIHEQVKNHPFRLDHSDWKGFYELLKQLDKEFYERIKECFEEENWSWSFFVHELRGAIWHFQFEFNEDKYKGEWGRVDSKGEYSKHPENYGKIMPEYQSKIIIIIENYIQQIHKFIVTGKFEEFITYYLGGDDEMKDIQSNGKTRWNKYKLNKETNKFEWAGKLE